MALGSIMAAVISIHAARKARDLVAAPVATACAAWGEVSDDVELHR
jgi:hypothetical protein